MELKATSKKISFLFVEFVDYSVVGIYLNDILCVVVFVVVFPTRFGKSFPCCVMPSHLGRSRLPPSPFQITPELFRVDQNSLQSNASGHSYYLELSCFVRDCASAVVGKVVGIDRGVVGSILRGRYSFRCLSATAI